MADELYNVVFKGELVRSFDLTVVKKNIGQLFKMDGQKLETLFSGKTIILKRNLNFDTATKYRVAIKKAGARVDLMPSESEAITLPSGGEVSGAKAVVKPQSDYPLQSEPKPGLDKAVFGERATDVMTSGVSSEVPMQEAANNEGQVDEGVFSLAPAGADVLSEAERRLQPNVDIDTSALSVKEAGGDLLELAEKRQFESVEVDFGGVDLAPPGESLLNDDEKKKEEVVAVDTGDLSVAEPGVRLGKPVAAPPPAPDVSNIHLEP